MTVNTIIKQGIADAIPHLSELYIKGMNPTFEMNRAGYERGYCVIIWNGMHRYPRTWFSCVVENEQDALELVDRLSKLWDCMHS